MEALRVSKTTYEKVNKLIAILMNEAHNFLHSQFIVKRFGHATAIHFWFFYMCLQ